MLAAMAMADRGIREGADWWPGDLPCLWSPLPDNLSCRLGKPETRSRSLKPLLVCFRKGEPGPWLVGLRPCQKDLEDRNFLDPNKDGEILFVIHIYAGCFPLVSLIYGFPPKLLYIGCTGLCGRELYVNLSTLALETTVTNPSRNTPWFRRYRSYFLFFVLGGPGILCHDTK